MPRASSDPASAARLHETVEALRAEIEERERATAVLARKNAELHAELERRLTESESFSQVLVSLLRKTALEQVLDVVCAQAQGLLGATGSAVLLLADGGWLEVKHRRGTPLAVATPVPVAGSVAGDVVRRGEPLMVNDTTVFEHAQVCRGAGPKASGTPEQVARGCKKDRLRDGDRSFTFVTQVGTGKPRPYNGFLVAPAAAAAAAVAAAAALLGAVAVRAVDRFVATGLEGHLGVLATLGADGRVHLALAVTRCAAVAAVGIAGGLAGGAASGATTRGAEALGLVKFLFAFGELELRAAVGASQSLICHVSFANSCC